MCRVSSSQLAQIMHRCSVTLSPLLLISMLAVCLGSSDSGHKPCEVPPAPEHGVSRVLWGGLWLQHRCQDGYRLEGVAAAVCRQGKWSHEPPICILDTDTTTKDSDAQRDEEMLGETLQTRNHNSAQLQAPHSRPILTVMAVPEPEVQKVNTTATKKGKKDGEAQRNQQNRKKDRGSKKNSDRSNQGPADKGRKKAKGDKANADDETRGKKTARTGSSNTESSTAVGVDLATLDSSCLRGEAGTDDVAVPAPQIPFASLKYARRRNKAAPHNRYVLAMYQCDKDAKLVESGADRLHCRQGEWIGRQPVCKSTKQPPPDDSAPSVELNKTPGGPATICGEDKGGCEHICHDAGNAIRCSCYRGYILSEDGFACLDIDECAQDNGGCEGLCVNRQGSYQCSCGPGFRLASNGKKCIDQNECLLRNGHGPCQGTCQNTHGSYTCSCEGLPGTQLASDGHSCEDMDECADNNFGCSHACLNTIGTAFCSCSEGFMLGEDWKTCEDIDECDLEDMNELCEGGCFNTMGSYYCGVDRRPDDEVPQLIPVNVSPNEVPKVASHPELKVAPEVKSSTAEVICNAGYELVNSTCQDINECLDHNFGCSHVCRNSPGSAFCECPSHYVLGADEKTCQDVDECAVDNYGCSHTCVNQKGSAYCTCPQGYVLTANDKTCEDVDECLQDNFECSHTCVNLPGGAECTCPLGFELAANKKTCKDVDECQEENGGCSHICKNTKGSHICLCPWGYQLANDSATCEDVDECQSELSPCGHSLGTCTNLPGSFVCSCPAGYVFADHQCIDLDECASSPCPGECENTVGSYRCICTPGYEYINNTCTDVDECLRSPCDQECVNLPGSYKCSCRKGFVLTDDQVCEDVDECAQVPCEGLCYNTPGSFTCGCPAGFTTSGSQCLDINECEADNPCEHHCVNQPGSYVCMCPPGFRVTNNGSCEDLDECANVDPCAGGECINTPGSYSCTCPPGYLFANLTCQDVDECLSSPCSGGGTCHNLPGSYRCECETNFVLKNNKCEDIDECISNPCHNGACINLPGSYHCVCDPGYELRNGRCEDIDECLTYKCGGKCVNFPGSYRCECPKGYELQGHQCVDINECIKNPCQGKCINLPGSYQCECEKGYRLEGHSCLDIDECGIQNGGCYHICQNTIGSYNCACFPGFEVNPRNVSQCVDINECKAHNGGCGQDCINTHGSFYCACSDQFYLAADKKTCAEKLPKCTRPAAPVYGEIECVAAQLEIEDSEEIETNGRGDMGHKIKKNFPKGSTCQLSCQKGYKLNGDTLITCGKDGQWTGQTATCVPLPCPRLQIPENALVVPPSCAAGKSFAGQQCHIRCKSGYKLSGGSQYICLSSQQWKSSEKQPRCEKIDSPNPFIQCPTNISVSLPHNQKKAYVSFPRPLSNMNWYRYVDAEPVWAKSLEGEFPAGKTTVTFRVRSPVQDLTDMCSFIVDVVDREPPRIVNCPNDPVIVDLANGETSQIVTWNEPIFHDNIGVVSLTKSREPGELFQAGKHRVIYEAKDAAGNSAKCEIAVDIKIPGKRIGKVKAVKYLPEKKLIRCPGSKPGKYIEHYTYKVPPGCIVINTPSAYTTPPPRPEIAAFDWNFGTTIAPAHPTLQTPQLHRESNSESLTRAMSSGSWHHPPCCKPPKTPQLARNPYYDANSYGPHNSYWQWNALVGSRDNNQISRIRTSAIPSPEGRAAPETHRLRHRISRDKRRLSTTIRPREIRPGPVSKDGQSQRRSRLRTQSPASVT